MKRELLPAMLDSRANFITSFDKLFDQMMSDSFPSFGKNFGVEFFGKSSYPKCDVIDTSNSIQIKAEIPGLSKEEVDISVEKNVLTIRGSKNAETEDVSEDKTYIFKELKHSSFSRRFALGENLDSKNISAKFNNGILEINIPKLVKNEEEKTTKISIE